ncbi:MAG: Oligopeptide transport system permease protein OppC [Betaproteobacteria bacterium ADurb.Bin341]|nr:MAG: Oligopeptide transport system permease protein OppC [Betaproteobacteria bacterium ADurb.Bin341]
METIKPESIRELPRDLFTRAPFQEEKSEETGFSNYSYWRSTLRTFLKSNLVKVLVVLVIALVLYTIIYPAMTDRDPYQSSLSAREWNLKPSWEHPFGTDGIGHDIWARVWFGTRTSLLLALMVAVFEVGLGVIIGALWGFYRKLDTLMFAIYNTLTNVPSTIYLVLIAYIMKPGVFTIIIALVATGWISEARWFRSRILALREADYNVASICLKTPTKRIISRNIVPHLMSLIIMDAALTIPYSIGSEVFLSFIGVGLPAEMCTLGNLVNQGRSSFQNYPYQMIAPTLILCFITVSFYIIGNKFADASDPKNHV